MNVNTAFLYNPLAEEVYVEQPEGFKIPGKENWVCKAESCSVWPQAIPTGMVLPHCAKKQSEADPCIFVYTNVKLEKAYIALYVDDFLIAGENEDDIIKIKGLLAERFDMKGLGIAEKLLGMEIENGENRSTQSSDQLRNAELSLNLYTVGYFSRAHQSN